MRLVGAASEDVRTDLDGVAIANELGVLPTLQILEMRISSRMHAHESLILLPSRYELYE